MAKKPKKRAKAGNAEQALYKVIEIVGTSPTSWAEAARNGITTASRHLRDLRVAEVDQLDVKVEDGNLLYRAKLKLSFKYHSDL